MAAVATAPNTIVLAGDFRREEGKASAALTPGHLVELISTDKWRKHATAKGFGERAFAMEDALQGKVITDAYAADDIVPVAICAPGAEVYAWLAATENVVIGDHLISNGAGLLKKKTGTSDLQVFAIALKALNLSASGAVDTRLAVRIV